MATPTHQARASWTSRAARRSAPEIERKASSAGSGSAAASPPKPAWPPRVSARRAPALPLGCRRLAEPAEGVPAEGGAGAWLVVGARLGGGELAGPV